MIKSVVRFFNNNRVLSVFIIVISLVAVVYPRFNRQDIGIVSKFTGTAPYELNCDNSSYLLMTECFQGAGELDKVSAPFVYRPLAPFLASFLPFGAFTSLNLFNVFVILLCAPLTFFIARKLGHSFGTAAIGVLLHFVSFPVFFYATTGFVDPISILMIYAFIWARVYRRNWLILLLYLASAWAKETTIMISAYLLFDIYCSDDEKKHREYSIVIAGSILFVLEIFLIRSIFTNPGVQMAWVPDSSIIFSNLMRAKTYLTFALSFGLSGVLSLLLLLKEGVWKINRAYISYYVGILTSVLLFVYSIMSAYSDGRFMWPAIPFAVVLSMRFIETKLEV